MWVTSFKNVLPATEKWRKLRNMIDPSKKKKDKETMLRIKAGRVHT